MNPKYGNLGLTVVLNLFIVFLVALYTQPASGMVHQKSFWSELLSPEHTSFTGWHDSNPKLCLETV